jgi:ABC-2 type transport system ATP-binding protein
LDEAEHCHQLAFIYGGRIIARGSPDALKHAPGSGVTVEIVSKENALLLDAVEDLAYVRGASLYGSALHVAVKDDADLQQLQRFLDARGLKPADRAIITPSLEDVFSGLVKAAGASERVAT